MGRPSGRNSGQCSMKLSSRIRFSLSHCYIYSYYECGPSQVKMSTSSSLGQTVWVYRGSMWAYPWYTSVRKTLEDPAYGVCAL